MCYGLLSSELPLATWLWLLTAALSDPFLHPTLALKPPTRVSSHLADVTRHHATNTAGPSQSAAGLFVGTVAACCHHDRRDTISDPPPGPYGYVADYHNFYLCFHSCINRSPGPPAILKPPEIQSEQEALEIAITKLLLKSYYDIVRKNIEDIVPKAIMHFLNIEINSLIVVKISILLEIGRSYEFYRENESQAMMDRAPCRNARIAIYDHDEWIVEDVDEDNMNDLGYPYEVDAPNEAELDIPDFIEELAAAAGEEEEQLMVEGEEDAFGENLNFDLNKSARTLHKFVPSPPSESSIACLLTIWTTGRISMMIESMAKGISR
ncbi:Dynamin-related protein 3A [Platanthera guangdongensis]|uniref:Dynamin-related protein 3A n=1 Tax=Platanthera guangdongensis TaxID=2320717 RepID=A0ABR2MQG8_9ASPA